VFGFLAIFKLTRNPRRSLDQWKESTDLQSYSPFVVVGAWQSVDRGEVASSAALPEEPAAKIGRPEARIEVRQKSANELPAMPPQRRLPTPMAAICSDGG
jgi:hypothetical protein